MRTIQIPAWYYQHFDADFRLEVPEEGFGGWKCQLLDFAVEHMGLVVMHAWDSGTFAQYPGWYRCVPYLPRAQQIARDVFPGLLKAVRCSPMPVFHVVGGGDYYKKLPGYLKAVDLAGPPQPPPKQIEQDPCHAQLFAFRRDYVHPGKGNLEDVRRGFERTDFMPEARPVGDEGIAENGDQLFALCDQAHVCHLIYCGFAIDWCLLLSPGGMADMARRGLICSALRQATTAVENKETAAKQLCKEIGLWRVALLYGFVFDVDPFIQALSQR